MIRTFLSNFFEPLTKNYHYCDKILSTKRQKIIIGSKKFCQAFEKSIWEVPNFSLQSYKLEFAGLQTPVWTKENLCLDINKLIQTGMCHYAAMMAGLLGRVPENLTLLDEAEASVVATDAKPRAEISLLNLCRGAKEESCKLTDAFIPRRRYAAPLQSVASWWLAGSAEYKKSWLCSRYAASLPTDLWTFITWKGREILHFIEKRCS